MFSESFNCDMEIGQRAALYLGSHAARECLLGFLEYGEDGIEAFTVDNVSLGLFEDERDADRALEDADANHAVFARFLLDAKPWSNGRRPAPPESSDEPHPMLAAALAYAKQHGWKTFPARMEDGKKWSWLAKKYAPGGENWGMTNDPEQLRHNFLNKDWRQACGVGVPTGWVNRIFDIEADTKEAHGADGLASLSMLEAKYGKLPDTLMAISPSGSPHRIYRHPGHDLKVISRGLPGYRGVDIKGDGGMFVAPPSARSDGEYRWLNDNPIADAPQWLIDLVVATSKGGGKGGNDRSEKAKPASMFNGQKPSAAFADLDLNHSLGQGISVELPPIERIRAAFAVIPNNDRDWDDWNTHGLALFAATAGSDDGLAVFHEWSKKSKEKYDEQRTTDRWAAYKTCPPDRIGAGSIFYWANEASPGWDLGLAAKGVTRADFRAYLPDHSYIFTPTGAFWSMAGVNACLHPTPMTDSDGKPVVFTRGENKGKPKFVGATGWLDRNQPVHHLTWAPGHPMLIENQLVIDGGWVERNGVTTFNLYRPPTLKHGDPSKAGPWLELVHKVYPEDAGRLIPCLAHRVKRPGEKINHAVVLGGTPGIGKDTILEPVKRAVGAWNFKETSPQQILGRFNGFLQSVIMRISEVRDLGEFNRYQFYEHTKAYFAAPPDTLRVDEKNIPEHDIMNCTFAILTTNRLTDGIFLPPDDRRHDVMWSGLTKDDFTEDYWIGIWNWYNTGGDSHVAAYLASLDISGFDPKAPPPKTAAFWAIVDANRAPEEGELQDLLDKLDNPDAVTLDQLINAALGVITRDQSGKAVLRAGLGAGPGARLGAHNTDLWHWLTDRKNRRSIPHRLDAVGYAPVRNEARDTGLWVVGGVRQVVYAKKSLSLRDQLAAVTVLQKEDVLTTKVEELLKDPIPGADQ